MLKLLPLYFDLSRYVILETLGGFTQRPYAILMNPLQFFYRDSDPYFPVFCYLSVQAFSPPSDFFYFCSLRDPHRKAQNMIEAKNETCLGFTKPLLLLSWFWQNPSLSYLPAGDALRKSHNTRFR